MRSSEAFSISYSRLPAASMHRAATANRPAPQATRTQRVLECLLFLVFGSTIALAGVALYATNRPEHLLVPNNVAAGVKANRVNVLLIGTSTRHGQAGESVSIQSLTMLSVQPSTGRAVLMSVPRDLWIRVGRHGTRPLHTAYAVGDSSGYPGAGAGLTVDTVQEVLGQPIHGYARLELSDLQKTIDALGGVNVNVARGVFEYRSNIRYPRGTQRLDGMRAVKYAHSPYFTGEARDRFAKEARQQQVLSALLVKAVSTGDNKAFVLRENSGTNLTIEQIKMLSDALRRGGAPQTMTFAPYVDVIDVSSVAYRGEAVTPRGGDFASLQRVAGSVFARM
jgi:LCP family protein required for cell wall assembly